MKHTNPLWLLFAAASLASVTLAGCATMRPLSSKPPVPRIVLGAPFDVRAWSGLLPPLPYHVLLPAGEYRPLYEDDKAYYYQAPAKIVVNDLGSSLWDGGIYVQRGTTTPTGWYYQNVDSDGTAGWNSGAFKTPPPTR
jgi:hypothetical protein